MRKPPFVNNQVYHIYNRGVEKRKIFLDEFDYFRFIHDLYEFNDTEPAGRFSQGVSLIDKKRDLLVEILCFCLMPNHFHLILRQTQEEGIYRFMKKLGTGYSMYFNKKNDRVGSLFQNRFKAILIGTDEYLLHLSRYIHLNPIELQDPGWKDKKVITNKKVLKFFRSYRWSSYLDYANKKNFPSIINQNLILSIVGGRKNYSNFINHYTCYDKNYVQKISFEL